MGALLRELTAEEGWEGANARAEGAQHIAPTLVGGSKKRGGPDLGPTRAGGMGGARRSGETHGRSMSGEFEAACADFVRETFPRLEMLRPGDWSVIKVAGRRSIDYIAAYDQYSHPRDLDFAVKSHPELRAALGNAYVIAPDVVVIREPGDDVFINQSEYLVDETVGRRAPIRRANQSRGILHAVISCKWTLRSDRAQNARSEALNLIRNREGRLPHIAVVTAEPSPSRLASLALGTGDIDTLYHFASGPLPSGPTRHPPSQ